MQGWERMSDVNLKVVALFDKHRIKTQNASG